MLKRVPPLSGSADKVPLRRAQRAAMPTIQLITRPHFRRWAKPQCRVFVHVLPVLPTIPMMPMGDPDMPVDRHRPRSAAATAAKVRPGVIG